MHRIQLFLIAFLTLIFAPMAASQGDAALPVVLPAGAVGVVTNVQGSLNASKPGVTARTLVVYDTVAEGDVLSTTVGAYARVKFADGGELILRPNSQAAITRYAYKAATPASDISVITLLKGGLRSLTGLMGKRNPQQVTFKTPTATIGIRGTDLGLLECKNNCADVMPPGNPPPPNGTHVDVTQGSVAVTNSGGQVLVINAGQFAHVRSPTSRPQLVPPSKGVQVTVPPAIRQEPPPKPQSGAAATSSSSQAAPEQTQPSDAAKPASSTTAATLDKSPDLSSAISQLPATAAGPAQQPAAAMQSASPTSSFSTTSSFGASRSASIGGGGTSSVSRSRN